MIKIILVLFIVVDLFGILNTEYNHEKLYTFKRMKKAYGHFKPDIKELKNGHFRAKFYRCGGKLNSLGYIFEKDKDCNIKILEADIEFNSKGLQDGERIFYYLYPNISKKPIKTGVSYSKNGLREGTVIGYNPKGRVSSYSKYKNDKLDGIKVKYNPATEKLIKVETYKNGKLNGPNTTYYPNGKIKLSINYKDEKMVGKYQSYYKNGNIKENSYKLKGDLRKNKEYYPNGVLKKEALFINHNYKDRKETSYSKDGKLTSIKYYNNNKEITKEEYEKLPKE